MDNIMYNRSMLSYRCREHECLCCAHLSCTSLVVVRCSARTGGGRSLEGYELQIIIENIKNKCASLSLSLGWAGLREIVFQKVRTG